MNETAGDYLIVLRAVSTTMSAVTMLYAAASLLTPGENDEQAAANLAVTRMVQMLLSIPDTNTDSIERVLRSLPEID